jgi:hypothetical protein
MPRGSRTQPAGRRGFLQVSGCIVPGVAGDDSPDRESTARSAPNGAAFERWAPDPTRRLSVTAAPRAGWDRPVAPARGEVYGATA